MANSEALRLDPDFRRVPKTNVHCVNCQNDIKDVSKAIHVTVNWETWEFTLGGDELLGPGCAKRLGVKSGKQ